MHAGPARDHSHDLRSRINFDYLRSEKNMLVDVVVFAVFFTFFSRGKQSFSEVKKAMNFFIFYHL